MTQAKQNETTRTLTKSGLKKSGYDPYKIRRRVRRDAEGTTPELEAFKTKSFTKANSDDVYFPTVDAEAGRAFCNCYHAVNVLKASYINKPETCCKHVLRAIAQMEAAGELAPLERRLADEADREAAKPVVNYLAMFED